MFLAGARTLLKVLSIVLFAQCAGTLSAQERTLIKLDNARVPIKQDKHSPSELFIGFTNLAEVPLQANEVVVAINNVRAQAKVYAREESGYRLRHPITSGKTGAFVLEIPAGENWDKQCGRLKVQVDLVDQLRPPAIRHLVSMYDNYIRPSAMPAQKMLVQNEIYASTCSHINL